MIVTEEEAREMRCCEPGCGEQHRVKIGGSIVKPKFYVYSNCIASKCMAWRWTGGYGQDKDGNEYPVMGYCGKAGKP